ncbi:hypothetical protein D3C80_1982890 [compost metagenome]
MLGQRLDVDAVAGKLGPPLQCHLDLLFQPLQPPGLEQPQVKVRGQLSPKMIAAQSCPAHGQRYAGHALLQAGLP